MSSCTGKCKGKGKGKGKGVYAGTVMTSFYNASSPTRGNWFQTNQPEHESDDCPADIVTSVCVANEKDMALQWQI